MISCTQFLITQDGEFSGVAVRICVMEGYRGIHLLGRYHGLMGRIHLVIRYAEVGNSTAPKRSKCCLDVLWIKIHIQAQTQTRTCDLRHVVRLLGTLADSPGDINEQCLVGACQQVH